MFNLIHDALTEELAKAYLEGKDEQTLLDSIGPTFEAIRPKLAKVLIRSLKKNRSEMLRERRKITERFEHRNFRRWRRVFDLYETLIVMASELGEEHDKDARPDAIRTNDYRFEALAHIFPKAVLISREILCLLRGGYPDAALSSWRGLFELTVVAKFISGNDQEIALRYLASFDFRALRAAREYNQFADRIDLAPFDDRSLQELEERAASIETQLGIRLKKDFDWAHPALQSKFPTLKPDRVDFSHLMEASEMDRWRPYYRWANQHLHAGHRPHGSLLGVCESTEPVALVGQSNSGFVDPFQLAAISLVHVTTLFLFTKPCMDRIVMVDALASFRDEVAPLAMKIQRDSLEAAGGANARR
jgi:hypothetical protein